MKTFFRLIFILLILITLSSCKQFNIFVDSFINNEKQHDNNVKNEHTSNKEEDDNENDDYLDIECKLASGYCNHKFGFQDSDIFLNIKVPLEWEFYRYDGESYEIKRNNELVGSLCVGDGSLDNWITVSTDVFSKNNITVHKYIEKFGTGESLAFRYRFVYTFIDSQIEKFITLIADYSEIDFSTSCMLTDMNLIHLSDLTRYGDLSDVGESPSILILGNSFIGSSKIGNILNEMTEVNGKTAQITAISRGYATVATYIEDEFIMTDIKNGQYDLVLICGLYSNVEVQNLNILKMACDESGAKLVVFPAHNEKSNVITLAINRYPDLYFLNWRDEINLFIDSGYNKYDFCINDSYSHSNSLAGYIGAHMIYRSIYGEAPKEALSYSINQSYVNNMLGSYVELSYIQKSITYFE